MKRLLLCTALLLSACAPTVSRPKTDPAPVTVTEVGGPGYAALTVNPGQTPALEAVAHLVGPRLRVNDARCVVEVTGLRCALGTLTPGRPAVVYVAGLSDVRVAYRRVAGGPVYVSP